MPESNFLPQQSSLPLMSAAGLLSSTVAPGADSAGPLVPLDQGLALDPAGGVPSAVWQQFQLPEGPQPTPQQQQWLSALALERHTEALAQQGAEQPPALHLSTAWLSQPDQQQQQQQQPFMPLSLFAGSFASRTTPPLLPPVLSCASADSPMTATTSDYPGASPSLSESSKRSAAQVPEEQGRRDKRQTLASGRYSTDCFTTASVFERLTLSRGLSANASSTTTGSTADGSSTSSSLDCHEHSNNSSSSSSASSGPNPNSFPTAEALAELNGALQGVDVNPFDEPDLFANGVLDEFDGTFADLLGPTAAHHFGGGPVTTDSANVSDVPYSIMMGSIFA